MVPVAATKDPCAAERDVVTLSCRSVQLARGGAVIVVTSITGSEGLHCSLYPVSFVMCSHLDRLPALRFAVPVLLFLSLNAHSKHGTETERESCYINRN